MCGFVSSAVRRAHVQHQPASCGHPRLPFQERYFGQRHRSPFLRLIRMCHLRYQHLAPLFRRHLLERYVAETSLDKRYLHHGVRAHQVSCRQGVYAELPKAFDSPRRQPICSGASRVDPICGELVLGHGPRRPFVLCRDLRKLVDEQQWVVPS